MRVALYARVSTEEQVRNGISIEAQLAALRDWARSEGHVIAGEYVDEGVSARKAPAKRAELQRLLNDLSEEQIALIAFCKLDRWTRNVKGYYQVQDVLDRHKVAWIAIQEDYETITASGRFKVNIMLSVAENEADRTSERIKAVQSHKVEKGEAISGSMPLGFKIENKRVVHNPDTVDMARDFFRHYMEHGSMQLTAKYMYSTCGYSVDYHTVRRMLRNSLYVGEYRENKDFCEPIIEKADFDEVQKMLAARSIRSNPTGRVYVFSGMLVCECCGRSMTAIFRKRASGATDTYYRCNHAVQYHRCTHHKMIQEAEIEKLLLDILPLEIDKWESEWAIEAKKKKKVPKVDKSSLLKKLDRLKDLYVDGLISKEQYLGDRGKIAEQLEAVSAVEDKPDFDAVRAKLGEDFRKAYGAFAPQEKRDFWRGILKSIHLSAENVPRVFFR